MKKGDNLFLIDWEYSGLNDPIWDLAAFSIESNLSDDEEKELLDYYFENNINSKYFLNKVFENYSKIEFIGNNWCEDTWNSSVKGENIGKI